MFLNSGSSATPSSHPSPQHNWSPESLPKTTRWTDSSSARNRTIFEYASGFSKEKKRKKQSVENRFPRWGVSNDVGVNFVCRQLSKIQSSQSKVFLFRLIILWICTMSIKSLTCKQQSCRVYWNGLEFMYFLVKYMCWSDQNKVDW